MSQKLGELTGVRTLSLANGGNTPYEYMSLMDSINRRFVREKAQSDVIIVFHPNDNILLAEEISRNHAINIVQKDQYGSIAPVEDYSASIKSYLSKYYSPSREEYINLLDSKLAPKSRNRFLESIALQKIYWLAKSIVRPHFIRIRHSALSPTESAIKKLSEICNLSCNSYMYIDSTFVRYI